MFRTSGTGRSNRRRPEVISRRSRVSASRLVGHAALAASVVLVVPLSGAVVASASAFRPALGHGGAKTGSPVAHPSPPTSTTTTVPSRAAHRHPTLGH
jgi:hypothetical protein